MLQFNTDKFWTDDHLEKRGFKEEQKKLLRREKVNVLLYTNAMKTNEDCFQSSGGSLGTTETIIVDQNFSISQLHYQFIHGSFLIPGMAVERPWFQALDFSALATFYLQAVFSPDLSKIQSLFQIIEQPRFKSPRDFLPHYFDQSRVITMNEWNNFQLFVDNLLLLPRDDYLTIMASVRAFVAAIYQTTEDTNQAYTMFTIAGETLVNNISQQYEPEWHDWNEEQREKLDKIFNTLDPQVVEDIKDTLLKGSHLKLTQKYINGIYSLIPKDWFESNHGFNHLNQLQFKNALKNSYILRSKYVHQLQDHSNLIESKYSFSLVAHSKNGKPKPCFTLLGLNTVIREAIIQFVLQAPKAPNEELEYFLPPARGVSTLKPDPKHFL